MNIELDIVKQYDGDLDKTTFDVYVSENNSSGAHYTDLTLEEIGEIVVDHISNSMDYIEERESEIL